MARRLGKGYQPNDIRTATFKLSHEKWEAFQGICRAQNRSASDVLLEFVESVLNDESIPTKDDGLGEIRAELAAINARLDKLEAPPPLIDDFGLEDGKLYSQSELARILGCQSIQIRDWIQNGISPKDARHQRIIPHLSFSHSEGKNKPNFYRFSLPPVEK